MTPTLTPFTVKTTDGVTVGDLPGVLLDDVRGEEREVGAFLVHQQAFEPEIELVITVRRGVHAPRVLDVDRRPVFEQTRVGRRCPDVVASREQERWTRQGRGILVEHRCKVRCAAHINVQPIHHHRGRVELSVEVVQADDRQRPAPPVPRSTSRSTRPCECWGSGIRMR